MPAGFRSVLYTPDVRAAQRATYGHEQDRPPEDARDRLGPRERQFLASRDSFYLASVTADGWPYVQHRGGPPGFLTVLDAERFAFPDYGGNRQLISIGNLAGAPRVALILVDYPTRTRLKLLGEARVVAPSASDFPRDLPGMAGAERAIEVRVRGFDWNCPQHITPRFTEREVAALLAPLQARVAELEALLAGR